MKLITYTGGYSAVMVDKLRFAKGEAQAVSDELAASLCGPMSAPTSTQFAYFVPAPAPKAAPAVTPAPTPSLKTPSGEE